MVAFVGVKNLCVCIRVRKAAMEEVNITELEARYFLDLFSCCDIEKTGKVPVLKATEMFRSSNIPDDILKNVCFRRCNDSPESARFLETPTQIIHLFSFCFFPFKKKSDNVISRNTTNSSVYVKSTVLFMP